MIDLNRKTAYSEVIYLENKSKKSSVGNFYPLPALNDEVSIVVNSKTKANWIISGYDLSGRIISSEIRFLEKGENKL